MPTPFIRYLFHPLMSHLAKCNRTSVEFISLPLKTVCKPQAHHPALHASVAHPAVPDPLSKCGDGHTNVLYTHLCCHILCPWFVKKNYILLEHIEANIQRLCEYMPIIRSTRCYACRYIEDALCHSRKLFSLSNSYAHRTRIHRDIHSRLVQNNYHNKRQMQDRWYK